MDMPQPTPGHARLADLVGHWVGEETIHPSPWAPEGSTAQGRNLCRLALNGFSVITDYEQSRDGQVTYTGHGVNTYDPQADIYRLHWFDSMGSPPEMFTGRFDGDILTIAHGGPGMHARLTYDFSEPGTWKARMEMSQDGKEWQAVFDGVYRKE